MERDWIYRVPGPTQAEVAIRELDVLPKNILVGMGVFAKGDPIRWYVYANTDDPNTEQVAFIEGVLNRVGKPSRLTIRELLVPKPIFMSTGLLPVILAALATVDADGYYPRRSN